jgi:hypothetical protein
MGKHIRRTLTITITESWTIVWTPEDDPLCHSTAIVPQQPQTQEEQDETHPTSLSGAEPGQPSANEPTAPSLMLVPQPGSVPSSSTGSSQRKRTRSRRTGSNPQRK